MFTCLAIAAVRGSAHLGVLPQGAKFLILFIVSPLHGGEGAREKPLDCTVCMNVCVLMRVCHYDPNCQESLRINKF